MTMFKKLAIATTASLFASAGIAVASDSKSYPASLCEVWSGSSNVFFSMRENLTGGPASMDCPVIKDGNNITSASVRVQDLNTVSAVECVLLTVSVSGTGFSVSNTPKAASAGNDAGWKTLSFSGLTVAPLGHSFISCTLPAFDLGQSRLANYFVVESD